MVPMVVKTAADVTQCRDDYLAGCELYRNACLEGRGLEGCDVGLRYGNVVVERGEGEEC